MTLLSRRGVLAGAAASVAAAGVARVAEVSSRGDVAVADATVARTVPFRGDHQAGIATPQQQHVRVAAYDVVPGAALVATLDAWTEAAERLTAGLPAAHDSGEAVGLGPSRLTVTVGFARPGLTLPAFRGEALDPRWCGGDVVVQACADDPQVAHHAVRTLTRLGRGLRPRWMQRGFLPAMQGTPRNLFGFADGTANLRGTDTRLLDEHVWNEDGGSVLVVRRIRMHLEKWDGSSLHEQERAIGRSKSTGARLAQARHGHATLARPEANEGVRLLRRGYAFDDGLDATGRLDAGLLFLAYVRDVEQFVRIQRCLAAHDEMNEYVTHVGSAVFACPRGLRAGESWGADTLRARGTR
jgi:deferrochelatase/peroxidase EfeB